MKILNTHLKLITIIFIILISCNEDKIEDNLFGTLTGTVVSDGDNIPLANVKITTQPTSSTVFTDINGDFQLESILIGTYSVQAEKDDYVTDFEGITVLVNKSVTVVFELITSTANNRPPSTPILITPSNNATDIPVSVNFIWNATDQNEDDELLYTLTLQNNQNNEVQIFEDLTEPGFTVSDLEYATKYFWQISVTDQINDPVQSEITSFNTLSTPENEYLIVKKVNANNVIYSTNIDGELLQLTSETNNSWRPRRNTIVNKIAFLQTIGAEVHLFIMNEDGTEKTQVTKNTAVNGFNLDEVDYTWKPTGESLLYPNFNKIYKINTNGSGLTEFYESTNGNFITEIDWCPNNNLIAIKANDNQGYNVEIYTMNQNKTIVDVVLTGVLGAAGGLNFNIDGTKLLYTYDVSQKELASYNIQESRIFIYNSITKTSTRINTATETGFNNLDPRFSPNENIVIFTHKGKSINAPKSIYSHDLNGETANFLELFSNAFMVDWEY